MLSIKSIFHREKKDQVAKLEKVNQDDKGTPWNRFLTALQELGKALQFPVAVLPFAAILNRFGALGIQYTTDVHGAIINEAGYWISFIIQKPGAIVFDNLPLLFAIGIAFGLAKDHRGEVALVGAVFYLAIAAMTAEHSLPEMIYRNVLTFDAHSTVDGKEVVTHLSSLFYVKTFASDGSTVNGGVYVLNIGVLGGITAGCLSAYLYNHFKEIKLPTALSFFGGRRFIPMMAMVAAIPTALAFAIVWPWIQWVLMKMGQAVANPENPAVAIPGTALYGLLNRLLLPFGLHQILNTFFWFQLPIHGDQIGSISGDVIAKDIWVNGDINAFTKGISTAGLFQSGFFPVMMGGVPAIALAMIMAAPKENRKNVAGFLGGVAAVSFISGITEPVEFSFVFISPLLLGIHAVLTALIVAGTTAMHIQIGFGFSAGLIDYIISFAQSWGFANHASGAYHVTANPLWILLLTVVAGGVYYVTFYTIITKLDIQTPGREKNFDDQGNEIEAEVTVKVKGSGKYADMAQKIVDAIGIENFETVDNCATRLRLVLKDNKEIDEAQIKASGAFGIKRLGNQALQIVIGPDVEHVANEVKKITGK